MEVQFCSRCNQSIPLRDIEAGEADYRLGEYLCTTCKYVKTPDQERSSSYLAFFLGLCLLGSLLAIAYLLFQEELFPPEPPPVQAAGPTDRDVLLAALDDLKRDLSTRSSRARENLDAGFDRVEMRLKKQEDSLLEAMRYIEALGKSQSKALSGEEAKKLKSDIKGILYEVEFIRDDLGKVKASVQGLKDDMKTASAAAPAAEVEPETAEPEVSEVDRWIAQLRDRDPVSRLLALKELGRFRGTKVIQALIDRLKDWNGSVRRVAAENLGNRKEESATPALVDLLKDTDAGVRETAVQALRSITGRRFGYKSGSSERKRDAAMTRWRQFVVNLVKKKG